MTGFLGLLKRNLLLYFKDVQAILFSLLTSIIVFVLYLLFLKGTFVDVIEKAMTNLQDLISLNDVEMLSDAILLSGILGSASITVSYNCLVTIIRDREHKIDYDISATPLKRWQIILAYFTAAVLSSFIMSLIISFIGIALLSFQGNLYLDASKILSLTAVDLLGALSATSLFMIVVLFFQSTSASSAFFGILSAVAGFVIGAYIPLSQFSKSVQSFCSLFPATGVTILYRNVLTGNLLHHINDGLQGIDNGMFVQGIKEGFSFNMPFFGSTFNHIGILVYVTLILAICLLAMVLIYPKVYKRK